MGLKTEGGADIRRVLGRGEASTPSIAACCPDVDDVAPVLQEYI